MRGQIFIIWAKLHLWKTLFEQKKMDDDNGKKVSVVKLKFLLSPPVEESLYNYIIHDTK